MTDHFDFEYYEGVTVRNRPEDSGLDFETFVERAVERCSLSAAQLTTELRRAGLMPPLWTVIDVADYLKQRYSANSGAQQ